MIFNSPYISHLIFIPDLYDLATVEVFEESTPYEVPVQTLHNPITSKSHPGNLNDDDINTAFTNSMSKCFDNIPLKLKTF